MKGIILKFVLILASVSSFAMAKVKVSKVNFSKENNFGVVTVSLDGQLKGMPELTVKNDIVQVAIPDTVVWPKVEKKITVQKTFDTMLLAYQYNKNLVRVRAQLPYTLKGKEGKVSVMLDDNKIKFYFPLEKTTAKKIVKAIKKAPAAKTAKAQNYDESYLDKLLKDKEKTSDVKLQKTEKFLETEIKKESVKVDEVKSRLSSVKKNGFDFSSYIFKFVGFFSLLVGGIYVLMNFFRKGMLKKGGLGFLSSTKVVEVLNTTYLGPKRSLLIVRVNKQVFLLSQSEKGMDFLTEIEDTAGLMKEGEKQVVGTNFDTNLESAEQQNKEFKLKDMTSAINNQNDTAGDHILKALEGDVEKVSLSKQIKNKIKELKPLQ